MAIKFQSVKNLTDKESIKNKEVVAGTTNTKMVELIDAYTGANDALGVEKDKLKDFEKKAKDAKKALVDYAEETLGDQDSGDYRGTGYRVKVGAKGRVVISTDEDKAREILGERFQELMKPELGKLRDYLSEDEQKEVFAEEFTGARRVTLKKI